MAFTIRPVWINEDDRSFNIFGQIVFTGNYTTGGDTGTFDFATANTSGFAAFLGGQTGVHATRTPVKAMVNIEGGFTAAFVPGTTATNFKVRIYNSTTGNEIAAAAYPAAITTNTFHQIDLFWKKNI